MREHDEMVALQLERDGVRMASGQHIPTHTRSRLGRRLVHHYDEWMGLCYQCDQPAQAHEGFCVVCGEPAKGRYCVPCARLLNDWLRVNDWWDD